MLDFKQLHDLAIAFPETERKGQSDRALPIPQQPVPEIHPASKWE